MPIFEYICRKCASSFEKIVLGRRAEPPTCPRCGSPQVEQQFSAFSTSSAATKTTGSCAPSGGG